MSSWTLNMYAKKLAPVQGVFRDFYKGGTKNKGGVYGMYKKSHLISKGYFCSNWHRILCYI